MNNIQQEAVEVIYASLKREWINTKEVHDDYGFSISTLAKWRMDNLNLPYSKMGKYIRYKRSDIEAFLNASRVTVVA